VKYEEEAMPYARVSTNKDIKEKTSDPNYILERG
jgi:hypothetical protein